MAYDSKQNLYYNIVINGKERDFNPSYCLHPEFYHSIFSLFPTGNYQLVNKYNSLYQAGLANIENTIQVEFGTSETSPVDILKDLIIESMEFDEANTQMDNGLICNFINKNALTLKRPSVEKAWQNKSASSIISEIMSPLVQSTDIDATGNLGNWLKPSNQTLEKFLIILKNRSLPATSLPSPMFMWIDLEGVFHFKSLASLLMVPPVLSIDLTDEDTGFQAPVDINYVDNGIRYSAYETSNNFQQYEYKVDGTGAISKLTKPKIDKLDGLTSTGIDDLIKMESAKYVEGYSHNKLPLKYIESKYVSNIYNLPLRFSFTILNNPKIKPGAVIQLIFPHNDEKELIDSSLSGNYLVTAVRKKESGLQYINDVYVASNSFIKPIPKA